MRGIEGNKTESSTVKEYGKVVGHSATHSGNGKVGFCDFVYLPRTGFESGRTIELKRFEFCRIKLGLDVSVPDGINKNDAYSACKNFILEMVRREEVAVGGGNYNTSTYYDITSEFLNV